MKKVFEAWNNQGRNPVYHKYMQEKLKKEWRMLYNALINLKSLEIKAIDLAKEFHDSYEELAPSFGYKTREDTKVFDENSNNGKLMIAVCERIIRNNITN